MAHANPKSVPSVDDDDSGALYGRCTCCFRISSAAVYAMNSLDPTRPLYATGQLPTDSDTQVSPLGYEQKICQEYVHANDADVPARHPTAGASLVVRLLKGTAHSKPAAVPADSQCSSWLASLVYPLGRYLVVPFYFGRVKVIGRENLPRSGPVILAPTHRSRWDAVMIPYAAGHDITGRHLRFMVSADEVRGLQGWFISTFRWVSDRHQSTRDRQSTTWCRSASGRRIPCHLSRRQYFLRDAGTAAEAGTGKTGATGRSQSPKSGYQSCADPCLLQQAVCPLALSSHNLHRTAPSCRRLQPENTEAKRSIVDG